MEQSTNMMLRAFDEMFPNEDAVRAWFEKARWPSGPECYHCGAIGKALSGLRRCVVEANASVMADGLPAYKHIGKGQAHFPVEHDGCLETQDRCLDRSVDLPTMERGAEHCGAVARL